MKKRNSAYLMLACSCLFLVGGCKKKDAIVQPASPAVSPQNGSVPTAPVQGKASSAQAAAPSVPTLEISSKKDPFKPYVIEQKVAKPLHRVSADALPIQQYEVLQFRVTGIIVGLKENRAQIVDPLGKAYVVREGMRIGSNDGKIVKITSNSIEVLELYREDNGKIVRRVIKLSLPKKG